MSLRTKLLPNYRLRQPNAAEEQTNIEGGSKWLNRLKFVFVFVFQLMKHCLNNGFHSAGDARHEAGGYYSPTAARPESAASSSPPTSGSVVVPQPINVSKMGSMQSAAAHGLGHPLHPQHGQHPQAAMRKYQCKMCPQVSLMMFNTRNRCKNN